MCSGACMLNGSAGHHLRRGGRLARERGRRSRHHADLRLDDVERGHELSRLDPTGAGQEAARTISLGAFRAASRNGSRRAVCRGHSGRSAFHLPASARRLQLERPVVKQLERDVPYSAFYFNPTNGKRYDLGTVISAGPPPKPFEGHTQPRLFEDRFQAADCLGLEGLRHADPAQGRPPGRRQRHGRPSWKRSNDADLMASADANSDAEAGIILRFHDADNYLVAILQSVAEGHFSS